MFPMNPMTMQLAMVYTLEGHKIDIPDQVYLLMEKPMEECLGY